MTLAREARLVNRHNLRTLLALILWFQNLRYLLLFSSLLSIRGFLDRPRLAIKRVNALVHVIRKPIAVLSLVNGSKVVLVHDLDLHLLLVKVLRISVVLADLALIYHTLLSAAVVFHLVHALLHAVGISPFHRLVLNNGILQGLAIGRPI